MKWKQRPCNACRQRGECVGVACQRWQVWFLEAWDGFNRKAEAEMQIRNRVPGDRLSYGLPHEDVDPCEKCPIRDWCEVPCQRRLWWWDRCMGKIRRRISE